MTKPGQLVAKVTSYDGAPCLAAQSTATRKSDLSSRRLKPLLFILAAVCLTGAPAAAAVDLEDPDEVVEAGADALDNIWDYPWYDSAKDDVKPVRLRVRKVEPTRQYTPSSTSTASGNTDWLKVLAWVVIAALLAALAYLLIRAYLLRETRNAAGGSAQTDDGRANEFDRVEALPFDIKRPRSNLLDEARRLYELGRYGEAMIYLYSYQLIELDKAQRIHLTKGKTNRQYLREVGGGDLARMLEQSMVAFEDVFFGGHTLDRSRFEVCWNQLGGFNALLRPTASAA